MTAKPPLCQVHAHLEASGRLVLEIGNDCVACSLNERANLLRMLAPFAPADAAKDSVTVLQELIKEIEQLKAQLASRLRSKSKRQKAEDVLRRSDLTAQIVQRDDIEYGHHDSLPRGEHVANRRAPRED